MRILTDEQLAEVDRISQEGRMKSVQIQILVDGLSEEVATALVNYQFQHNPVQLPFVRAYFKSAQYISGSLELRYEPFGEILTVLDEGNNNRQSLERGQE